MTRQVSTTTRSGSKTGYGCLILFALPFALVGIGCLIGVGSTLWSWLSAQQWEEVPAKIIEAELVSNSGSKSTTYSVKASYKYDYKGTSYTGTRVSFSTGSDNIGDFHQRTSAELIEHRDSGEPFHCFVDPSDPSKSVLYRDLRYGPLLMLGVFGLVFGGVGIGIMWFGIFGRGREKRREEISKLYPTEPWRGEPKWATNRIRSNSSTLFIVSVIMAFVWNAISWPAAYGIILEIQRKAPVSDLEKVQEFLARTFNDAWPCRA